MTVKAVPVSDCKLTRKQIEKLLHRLSKCRPARRATGSRWTRTASWPAAFAKFVQGCKDELIARLGLKPNTLVVIAAGSLRQQKTDRRSHARPSA